MIGPWSSHDSSCHSLQNYVSHGQSPWTGRNFISPKHWNKLVVMTDWLTSWSRVLSEKLTFPQLIQKFSTFYGTCSFITTSTKTSHSPLSWARWIHSMLSHHVLITCILISSPLYAIFHLVSLSQVFPHTHTHTHTHVYLLAHMCAAFYPTQCSNPKYCN